MEIGERKKIDKKTIAREQTTEEEEDGVDMEEGKRETTRKKIIIPEEDMMKDGMKDKEEEDSDPEEEGEEEELEVIEGTEEPAGRILHLHLLGRKAWLGQEATYPPNHQPGVIKKRIWRIKELT